MIHALLFVIVAAATPTPHAQRTAPPSGIEIGPPMEYPKAQAKPGASRGRPPVSGEWAVKSPAKPIFNPPPDWMRSDTLQSPNLPGFKAIGTWQNNAPLPNASQSISLAETDSSSTLSHIVSAQVAAAKKASSTFRLETNEAQKLCYGVRGRFIAYSNVTRNQRYIVEQMYASGSGRAYVLTYQRPYGVSQSAAAHESLKSLCPGSRIL